MLPLPAKIPGRPFKQLLGFGLHVCSARWQRICVLDKAGVKFPRSRAASDAVRAGVVHVRPQ